MGRKLQQVFRNVGIQNSDTGELPRKRDKTFRTRRKFEIKNTSPLWGGNCNKCSETSAYKIHTPGNYPVESIQHPEHGKSLKSRILHLYGKKTATTVFRNVGIQTSDTGKLPRRKHTTFRTHRKFEIKNTSPLWGGNCNKCSETSAYKIHTPGNYPVESIQHPEHGKSLKSRILHLYGEETATTLFRNVGIQTSDTGELPSRKHTAFKTRQKFVIIVFCLIFNFLLFFL
jgi:hypothetical protein